MRLWLDDVRPAPEGWTWVKTVPEAKALVAECMERGVAIEAMSLDHDLGMVVDAGSGVVLAQEKLAESGYQFVCWLEAFNLWPPCQPTVHSVNPVGRARMLQAIERHYASEEYIVWRSGS